MLWASLIYIWNLLHYYDIFKRHLLTPYVFINWMIITLFFYDFPAGNVRPSFQDIIKTMFPAFSIFVRHNSSSWQSYYLSPMFRSDEAEVICDVVVLTHTQKCQRNDISDLKNIQRMNLRHVRHLGRHWTRNSSKTHVQHSYSVYRVRWIPVLIDLPKLNL